MTQNTPAAAGGAPLPASDTAPAACAADEHRTAAPAVVDVLVIGGGIAALCAAIEAAAAGARVQLLEAAPRALRGGNSRHSRNLRLANAQETPWQRDRYPVKDFAEELGRVTAHVASSGAGQAGESGAPGAAGGAASDVDLAATLAAGSAGLDAWLMAHGVALQPTAGGLLPFSRKTVFFLGGGKAMVNALYAAAEAAGVAIAYDSRVATLPTDAADGANAGPVDILAETPAGARRFTAGAVVLASGGYPANRDWLAERWGDAAARFANRGTPFQRGELLRALLDAGAQPAGTAGDCHLVAVDARAPQDDAGIVSRVDGMPLGVVVGADGRRFHDEGEDIGPIRFSHWGQRLAHLPGQRAWLVLDADGVAALPPLLYPPLSAPTLPALAARAGIDGEALVATLAAYNAAVADALASGASGKSCAQPPGQPVRQIHASPPTRPLLRAPFAAIPMQPGVSFTCFGVATDAQARVRRADGGVWPRLFAAGMIMAPAVLGSAYLSGAALTIGAVFGRIAGREAARAAREAA